MRKTTKKGRKKEVMEIGLKGTLAISDYDDNKYDKYPYSDVTQRIIGCAIDVHKNLGPGFKESAYENALLVEFDKRQMHYERQKPVIIDYKGTKVGGYRIDLLVEEKVIVELKTVTRVTTADCRRLLSYLKVTKKKVGLLVNFAKPIVEIKRLVL